MTEACAAHELTKRFEEVEAVAGVSFSVEQGELFGFLGPNGAGKSTTIHMLTGLARPDAGKIRIAGIDCSRNPRAAQHLIGVVPDESNLYPELTGFENLCFCAALYGVDSREGRRRARDLLASFGLASAADRRFGGYSKGMKRRLTIAAGIIHRPRILFLDEPTTGIDVTGARDLRRLIADLHEQGTTIFLTTHYIEEAERLCDRVAFIVAGRLVALDAVEHFLQPEQEKHRVEIVCTELPADLPGKLRAGFSELEFAQPGPGRLRVESSRGPVPVGPLIRALEEDGCDVTEARRMRPSLEDVFVRLTGIEATALRTEKGGGR